MEKSLSLKNSTSLYEPLQTPVVANYDVVVCGAGPAGVSAAIAAARAGASTALLETHGCLGGVWTAGALCWIIDHENKNGIMREILHRLRSMDAGPNGALQSGSSAYDVESMKYLLEAMTTEAGVRVRLHTHVVATRVNFQRRLTHVITESKSGREAWKAKIFIDATGDGDVAAQAGCRFAIGHPEHGESQPMSLMALLTGIDPELVKSFYDRSSPQRQEQAKKALYQLLRQHGYTPSYSSPTLFYIHQNLYALMANHEYGYRSTNADDITRATLHARAEIHQIIQTLRRSGGAWRHLSLVATAEQIGTREGRRILGRYTLTRDDLIEGRQQPDAICSPTFCVDVHSTNPRRGKSYDNAGVIVSPYQIPLRAAQPADVDGLLLAGRCISGDFIAHASYRVTGNAVEMGENVGLYAALCTQSPHLIEIEA